MKYAAVEVGDSDDGGLVQRDGYHAVRWIGIDVDDGIINIVDTYIVLNYAEVGVESGVADDEYLPRVVGVAVAPLVKLIMVCI